ncbi:astacin-like [Anopheles darlingi]|uniref:astacin-like n=1 Tax=Anopheles darlingi TaxID=43151 RepID=UPI002100084D|nr:astacin-like [Anopheles darlingi]
MVNGRGILVAACLVLCGCAFVEAQWRITDPSYLVGERLRSYHHQHGHLPRSQRRRPYEFGKGVYHEMDIMLKAPRQRNGVALTAFPDSRWPNAIVPYVITGSFTAAEQAIILQGMNEIATKTCVRFVAQTTQPLYVSITNTATGCWSYVGRSLTNTENQVNLQNPSCVDISTVVHELMHSIGFYHEFTRPDRDSYVSIDQGALDPQYQTATFYKDNFQKMAYSDVVLYGRPYDYGSVMHYSKYAAAASRSRPVMNNLQPWTGDFGNDYGLSPSDVIDINYMYCNGTSTTTAAATTTTTTTTTTKAATTTAAAGSTTKATGTTTARVTSTRATTTTAAPTRTTTTTAAPTRTTTTRPPFVTIFPRDSGIIVRIIDGPITTLINLIRGLPIFNLFG